MNEADMMNDNSNDDNDDNDDDNTEVILTSLNVVPGTTVRRFLGVISLHFIKESVAVRSDDELGIFFHEFMLEISTMVRAHAAALGANALLCFSATPEESQGGRNQVYHMMSVMGAAVVIEPASNTKHLLDIALRKDPSDDRIRPLFQRYKSLNVTKDTIFNHLQSGGGGSIGKSNDKNENGGDTLNSPENTGSIRRRSSSEIFDPW
eukprot:CAMPEP_0114362902 /NCGR_PEP_ID=MMETSP0101-20121206/26068_1 /TAXON_ID=38822 ORGANISM="Pteridomonas danica, Strain PT" /NCGR_SAMPLE_ID=MMETSP0101 /ASSEMBLY_ACC=CAM_ASM_000211 /LENGTH=206 /DNA_ID=CAMNT_0001509083 /DNA_START=1 /DNA_END=618 /DNA_ORIENTATION=-